MTIGPIMLDVAGTELSAEDEARLCHPLVGGVILFSKNYESPRQLGELTSAIRRLRAVPPLIAVDHEGGRVQRFREGFTRIPPMRALGAMWEKNPRRGRELARETGYVMGSELRAWGIDFSFAPVLDVDFGQSFIIGDRSFHNEPQAIAELAHGLMQGMKDAGMAAVGKHFPGHGYVRADSHVEVPVDERSYADLCLCDLIPFRQMIDYGLPGIMPAHVIYPRIDPHPAGFSRKWLTEILRGELGFEGAIFSDDLSMEGASVAGGFVERALAAFHAGCDMALVCNHSAAADEILAALKWEMPPPSLARLARMRGRANPPSADTLHEDPRFAKAVRDVASIGIESGDLALGPGS